jgi:hypothetical protein
MRTTCDSMKKMSFVSIFSFKALTVIPFASNKFSTLYSKEMKAYRISKKNIALLLGLLG